MIQNRIKLTVFFLLVGLGISLSTKYLFAETNDAALKDALEKANRGDSQQAISDLEKLKAAMPSDARVSLSLGLLYQSTDQHEKAISELENAVSLSPSSHGYYALGHLYESKWLKTDDNQWKEKAVQIWEKYLKITPMDNPHRSSAEQHLKRLRNNG